MKKKRLEVEWWPVERVVPYGNNPRIAPETAVVKVASSLKTYGWKQPIVVDGEGIIIVGHTRYAAALRLGMKEVPVVVANDLTEAEAKGYRLADNRTNQETTWDYQLLNLELEGLVGQLDLELTAFDSWELTGLPLRGGGTDVRDEWAGMPDFDVDNLRGAAHLVVHFVTLEDREEFFRLIGREPSPTLWWPQPIEHVGSDQSLQYEAEP